MLQVDKFLLLIRIFERKKERKKEKVPEMAFKMWKFKSTMELCCEHVNFHFCAFFYFKFFWETAGNLHLNKTWGGNAFLSSGYQKYVKLFLIMKIVKVVIYGTSKKKIHLKENIHFLWVALRIGYREWVLFCFVLFSAKLQAFYSVLLRANT